MPTGRMRIGIIEDDEIIAMALAAMLTEHGATVVSSAHSYDEALAAIQAGVACDTFFVDLHLHGKPTGIDLAHRAVRAGYAVVVMTGGSSIPDELSGVGLLLKPFSRDQVADLVHRLSRRAPRVT